MTEEHQVLTASSHHEGGGETYTQLNLKYGNVVLDCRRPRSGDRHAREPVPGNSGDTYPIILAPAASTSYVVAANA